MHVLVLVLLLSCIMHGSKIRDVPAALIMRNNKQQVSYEAELQVYAMEGGGGGGGECDRSLFSCLYRECRSVTFVVAKGCLRVCFICNFCLLLFACAWSVKVFFFLQL